MSRITREDIQSAQGYWDAHGFNAGNEIALAMAEYAKAKQISRLETPLPHSTPVTWDEVREGLRPAKGKP